MNRHFPVAVEYKCNICGGTKFVPGYNGRLVHGRDPQCVGCGSMERHRCIRNMYLALGQSYLAGFSCIQFSSDQAVPRDYFSKFMISEYGGANSQDLAAITYGDQSFDWVICNHVLEHVENDAKAIRELVRICSSRGMVQVSFPMPHFLIKTNDWGYAKAEDHGHFRYYGADVVDNLLRLSGARGALCVTPLDVATGAWEFVYLLSRDSGVLSAVGSRLNKCMPCLTYSF